VVNLDLRIDSDNVLLEPQQLAAGQIRGKGEGDVADPVSRYGVTERFSALREVWAAGVVLGLDPARGWNLVLAQNYAVQPAVWIPSLN
jgi:hypothetical protein